MKKLYLLFLSLMVTGQAMGLTYYVATDGSDATANPNSASTPLKTLQAALGKVVAGDTIKLATGTAANPAVYPGWANTKTSGTAGALITIDGGNRATTVLSGSLVALRFSNSYYHLTNVKLYSPQESTWLTCGDVPYPVNGGSGIEFYGDRAHHITVDFCDFAGGLTMLSMVSANTGDVTGAQLEDGTAGPHNNLVENNNFHNIYASNTTYGSGTGYAISSNGYDNIFRKNDFRESHSNDVIRPFGLRNVFSENTFYDIQQLMNKACTGSVNHTDVFQVYHVQNSSKIASKDIVIERNQFLYLRCQFLNVENNGLKDDPATADVDEYAVTSASSMENWIIRNNLFINSRFTMNTQLPFFKYYNNTFYHNYDLTGFGSQVETGVRSLGKYTEGTSTTNIKGDGRFADIQNNLFVEVGTLNAYGYYDNANKGGTGVNDPKPQSTANYNQHSGKLGVKKTIGTNGAFGANDINGGTGAEYFINAGTAAEKFWDGNFGPKTGSPAIGAGTNLSATGFSNDFYGNPRTGTWDLGAIANGSTGPSPTPSPTPASTPPPSAPKFTSTNTTTFTVGVLKSFDVQTDSSNATITQAGSGGAAVTLPPGVAFVTPTPANGTAKYTGTATSGAGTTYNNVLTATNSAGSTTQPFALTVKAASQAPTITTPAAHTWTKGVPYTFQINVDPKSPVPTISLISGTLPAQLSFTDNGNGTAKISGIATTATTAPHPVVRIKVVNGTTPDATQDFTATVTDPPSAPTATPAIIHIKP